MFRFAYEQFLYLLILIPLLVLLFVYAFRQKIKAMTLFRNAILIHRLTHAFIGKQLICIVGSLFFIMAVEAHAQVIHGEDSFHRDVLIGQNYTSKAPGGFVVGSQLLIGGMCGFLGGIVGGGIGVATEILLTGNKYELSGIMGFLIGGSLGLVFGSAGGVYAIGYRFDQGGSFWAALGGSALGLVIGFAFDTDLSDGPSVLFFIAPALGAVTGYHLTIKSKEPVETKKSSLHFRHGDFHVCLLKPGTATLTKAGLRWNRQGEFIRLCMSF